VTTLFRQGLPNVIMCDGKSVTGKNVAEGNTHATRICTVRSLCRAVSCKRRPPYRPDARRFINKERDFHRFGFQFAGVKYRMVNEVQAFCPESVRRSARRNKEIKKSRKN
jgi:hypothetical protein